MWHKRTSHVTHTDESDYIQVLKTRRAHRDQKWVMSHIRTRHRTNMNESCHAYERVIKYMWMIQVTCISDEDGDENTRAAMSHVTHTNTSCHTYGTRMRVSTENTTSPNQEISWFKKKIKPHVRIRHVSRTNESCHAYRWVWLHVGAENAMSTHGPNMSHVTHTNES